MNAVIYVRQSLDRDGEGLAVDRQLEACQELADKLGLTVDRIFTDNNKSATKGVRPAYQALLTAIESDEVKTLIVWGADRLYRKMRDLLDLIDLVNQHAVMIHVVNASHIDLSTLDGRQLAQVGAIFSQGEGERKSLRQQAANLQRAKKGQWQFSVRPYAYERVAGEVRIVEEEAKYLREAYERFISGETLYSICAGLNVQGSRTTKGFEWTQTVLSRRLANPAYAGLRLYKGELVAEGDWEPVISRDTWDLYVSAKSRRAVRHDWSNKTKYLLSGLAVCGECGGRLLARPQTKSGKGSNRTTYMSYACTTNWCVSRRVDLVDVLVEEQMIARVSLPDIVTLMRPKKDLQPLFAEADSLRSRRDDLALLLADGTLTPAAVRTASEGLQKRLEVVQREIASAQGNQTLSGLLLAEDIQEHWSTRLTLNQKREIIKALATVKLYKQERTRGFDEDKVRLEWKGKTNE